MTVSDRIYLSIGEVLALLQDEFPDVTISKIRFLESQGLIDPERTPSGYRKFYAADIERLRFILHEQRTHYLPLKVIRDRLTDDQEPVSADQPMHPMPATATPAVLRPVAPASSLPMTHAVPEGRSAVRTQPDAVEPSGPTGPGDREVVSLSFDELAKASGLAHGHLRELESFGLVTGRSVGMVVSYGPEALHVARLAASFHLHGLEPRHLRMFRIAAEREAALYEQIVLPLVKQRNPQARTQAASMLSEMSSLGSELRRAMLNEALRPYTDH